MIQKENLISGSSTLAFSKEGYELLDEIFKKKFFSKIFILVDENSLEYCFDKFFSEFKCFPKEYFIIEIPAEESSKNIITCEKIWSDLKKNTADRNSLLINLGGGVLCDVGSFAASCFMRGISFINVPTTLLSQVDASVGGKCGVNFENAKNLVGLFSEPLMTIIDVSFNATLPEREIVCGFAELIKHGLIADKDYYEEIFSKDDFLEEEIEDIIYRSVKIKIDIISEDLRELNRRKALNFGHNIAHALEKLFADENKNIKHGEALAFGLICEAFLSDIDNKQKQILKQRILKMFSFPSLEEQFIKKLIENLKFDKKNIDGKLNFTLLDRNIGRTLCDNFKTEQQVEEAILQTLESI